MGPYKKNFLLAGICCFLFAFSCATDKKPVPLKQFRATAPDGMILIEAETFRLVGSKIIDDPEASGGKAVTMYTARAFCSYELDLDPGTYVAVARVKAPDDEHDELYLSALNSLAGLDTDGVYNRYRYGNKILEFTIVENTMDYIQFAAFSTLNPKGKEGVTVDYIIICEKSRWETGPLELK